MKNMKKLASLLLVLVMVFALAAPALATDVTIDIDTPDGEDTGETYTVYKIFDATVNGETSKTEGEEGDETTISEFKNVSYTIESTSPFFSTIENFKVGEENAFTLTQVNGTTKYVVTMAKEYSAAELATALLAVEGKTPVTGLDGVKAPLKVDNKGYYLITSSLGSKAVVDTVGEQNMTIKTKNDLPTLTKKITAVENGNANDNVHGTVSYSSVVTYTITVNIPASAVGAITVHDKMDSRLTYGGMTADDGITEKTTDLTDGCTQEYELTAEYVAANLDKDVTIVYTATVQNGVDTNTLLKNSAHLTYSNYTSNPSEVDVVTYEFDLVKTTSDGTLLDGAAFKLYNAETGGTAYTFTYDEATKTYSYNAEGTVTDLVVKDGMVTVKGLAAGKYYLEETVTPDGYNTLTARQPVNLDGNSKANIVDGKAEAGKGEIVVNLTGAELPSTGGIGTTLFYIVGGLLIVGAAVLLITKKRVNSEQ